MYQNFCFLCLFSYIVKFISRIIYFVLELYLIFSLKRCIKRTMGRSELKNAETAENWACYVCDKTSMTELRALHRAILSNLEESEVQDDNLSR